MENDQTPDTALGAISLAKSELAAAANVGDEGAQIAQTPKSHNDVLTTVVHAALLLLNLFETIFHHASGTPGAGGVVSSIVKPPDSQSDGASETNTTTP